MCAPNDNNLYVIEGRANKVCSARDREIKSAFNWTEHKQKIWSICRL